MNHVVAWKQSLRPGMIRASEAACHAGKMV